MKQMRWLCVLGICAVACKEQGPAAGSKSAASPEVVPPDAALVAQPPPDAPVAAPPAALIVTEAGVGPLSGVTQGADDDATLAAIKAALAGHPELTVQFDVMDISEEAEEGYFSVEHGEEEVLQVMRIEDNKLLVRVVAPQVHTADGLHVDIKVSELVAKRPDVVCVAWTDDRGYRFLSCSSPGEPHVKFVVDSTDYVGKGMKDGKPVPIKTIASREIVAIER
jgi:hypothetical protein